MSHKNIIICSDGTGNSANKGRGTNVFKLFEAVDVENASGTKQLVIYDDGVGTSRLAPLRHFTGATGAGLARNVRQLYRALSLCYEPGDRIYLFGFSRGAYTARVVAGIITDCGIIDLKKPSPIQWLGFLKPGDGLWLRFVSWRCWRAHRWGYKSWLESAFDFVMTKLGLKALLSPAFRALGLGIDPEQFRARFATPDTKEGGQVRFIGVWDTVAAVGLPLQGLTDFVDKVLFRFTFPNRALSDRVAKACHALAIDEERRSFWPVLWHENDEEAVFNKATFEQVSDDYSASHDGESDPDLFKEPRIEQVWFAGVHSNVGGGYPKQGLSLVALDWMLDNAARHGLRFSNTARNTIRETQNVYDKLYNSRRGPGVLYHYKPRDAGKLCEENNAIPRLHCSAVRRINDRINSWAPGGFPDDVLLVDNVGNQCASSLATARFSPGNHKELCDKSKPWVLLRRTCWYLIIFTLVYVVHVAVAAQPEGWAGFMSGGYKNFFTSPSLISPTGIYEKIIKPVYSNGLARVLVPVMILMCWLGSFVGKTAIQSARVRFWKKTV